MRVRADGEDDFSGSEPDEMGCGFLAETGVGAGDEDGFGGEGGGGWWGFVNDLREEVAPDAHVVVRRKGGGDFASGDGRNGLGRWSVFLQRHFFR